MVAGQARLRLTTETGANQTAPNSNNGNRPQRINTPGSRTAVRRGPLVAISPTRDVIESSSLLSLLAADFDAPGRLFSCPDSACPTRATPWKGVRLVMFFQTSTAAAAGTWKLGDLTVNRIGFGAMRLTGSAPGASSDRDRSISVLRRAVELGVNHIDTAAFYFSPMRSANELINRALAPYPEDLVITTKVWPGRDPSGDVVAGDTRTAARPGRGEPPSARPRAPGRREPARLPSGKAGSIAEHFGALATCATPGSSAISAYPMPRPRTWRRHRPSRRSSACRTPTASARRPRTQEFLLRPAATWASRSCRSSRSPAPGARQGSNAADSEAVLAVARAHGASAAQVRLAWTLQQGPHVLAIPGTGDPGHLVENVAAGAMRLSDDEMESLTP